MMKVPHYQQASNYAINIGGEITRKRPARGREGAALCCYVRHVELLSVGIASSPPSALQQRPAAKGSERAEREKKRGGVGSGRA